MSVRTDRFRDLIAGLLALAMLVAASVGAWSLLSSPGTTAATTGLDELVTDSPDDDTVEQVADRDGDDAEEPQLRISVQTSTTLAVDRSRPVLVDVATPEGTPLPGDTPVAVRASISPSSELAGYVAVLPTRTTTTVHELRLSKLEIAIAPGAPCDVAAGTLQVRVAELEGQTRSAAHEVDLPDVLCAPELREASEAIHMTDPICGNEDPEEGDHAEELRNILDGEDQEQTWCMSDEKARELGLLREPTPPAREPEEPEEPDEPDEDEEDDDGDDGDGDGDDGDGNGDDGDGDGGNGDDGNGDGGDDGDGNGNGGNGDGGNGDEGDGDGDGNGGNGDGGNGNGGDRGGNGGGDDDGDGDD